MNGISIITLINCLLGYESLSCLSEVHSPFLHLLRPYISPPLRHQNYVLINGLYHSEPNLFECNDDDFAINTSWASHNHTDSDLIMVTLQISLWCVFLLHLYFVSTLSSLI